MNVFDMFMGIVNPDLSEQIVDLENANKVLEMCVGIVNPKSKEQFGLESLVKHFESSNVTRKNQMFDDKSCDQEGQNLDHLGQNSNDLENVSYFENRGRPPENDVFKKKAGKEEVRLMYPSNVNQNKKF